MEVWNNCLHPQDPWLSFICRSCHHGRRAPGRPSSEQWSESSQPKPLPYHRPVQCPMSQSSKIASQSVIHISFLSGVSSRRCDICSLEPRDPLWETEYSHSPEPYAPLLRAQYLWRIQRKERPCWALTCPRLWAHRVLQIEDSDLFLKGILRGHSSSSSKAAQQLWGEQWNPRLQDHRQKSQNIWVISCLF